MAINRNLRSVKFADKSRTYQPEEVPEKEDLDGADNMTEGFGEPTPPFTDPFNCLPPDEPLLNDEEKEEVKQEIINSGENIPEINENTEFEATVEPDEEAQDKRVLMIDGVAKALETAKEAVKKIGGQVKDKVRNYTNKAKFDKASFAKPKDSQASKLPKFLMAGGVAIAAGIYFGVEANSEYIYTNGGKPNNLSYVFSWLMDSPPVSLSPFYTDVFFTAFFVTLLIVAVVIFFIWDSSTQKKARREGHEHGKARLATPSDFKKYKKRFMD